MSGHGYDYMRKFHDDLTIEELEETDMEKRFEKVSGSIMFAGWVQGLVMEALRAELIEALQPTMEVICEAAAELMKSLANVFSVVEEALRIEYKDKELIKVQKHERRKCRKPVDQYKRPVQIRARNNLR